MSNLYLTSSKFDLTPKRHHGYAVFLFILGTLFPPLAVAARFGIGFDFWLNLLLTICGYFPGHGHNFYIQNIRNNKNHRRTPKWAQRYGLVDTSEIKRKERKSQWAVRYNERLPQSTHEGQPCEEGEVPDRQEGIESTIGDDVRKSNGRADEPNQFWNPEEEHYYKHANGANRSTTSLESGNTNRGRWHYPANFEDSLPPDPSKGLEKKKSKKDRWARTKDAYMQNEPRKSKSKKRSKGRSTADGRDSDILDRRTDTSDETGFPEDPEGGLHRDRAAVPDAALADVGRPRDELEHEF